LCSAIKYGGRKNQSDFANDDFILVKAEKARLNNKTTLFKLIIGRSLKPFAESA
jgi:hypothetical protein